MASPPKILFAVNNEHEEESHYITVKNNEAVCKSHSARFDDTARLDDSQVVLLIWHVEKVLLKIEYTKCVRRHLPFSSFSTSLTSIKHIIRNGRHNYVALYGTLKACHDPAQMWMYLRL